MRSKLREIGNSVGIIIPAHLLKKHNLHIGDDLICNDSDDEIILKIDKPKKYKLRDLVLQSKQQTLSEEDQKWLSLEDIGEEIVWNE